MSINKSKRLIFKDDGTIIVRTGTQTNCGGMAQVHIRITKSQNQKITFWPDKSLLSLKSEFGLSVPGTNVPEQYLNALQKGIRKAYTNLDLTGGIYFELIEALVHPTDATEAKFMEAGELAIIGWIDSMQIKLIE